MAHFYAQVQGHRGVGARCGSKEKGIWGHIRGWDVGVFVEASHDPKRGCDIIRVYKTKGSNGGPFDRELLITLYDDAEAEFADALRERFGISLPGARKETV